jgi:hypothetical protein
MRENLWFIIRICYKVSAKISTQPSWWGVPSRQTIHNLVNKLTSTGLLIDKRRVLTEKLDDTRTRPKHTPRKSQKRQAHETECQRVKERQHNCWSLLDLIQKQQTTPCSRAIHLAGFIFEVDFYSLSSKARSICNWHGHQQLLRSMNCKYFIPNVIGQQAYWFIGKIRTRLAVGGAPVAVIRSAVNWSTQVKTSM